MNAAQLDRRNRIALLEDTLVDLVVLDVVRVLERFEPWVQLLRTPDQVWRLFAKAVRGAGSKLDHGDDPCIFIVDGIVLECCQRLWQESKLAFFVDHSVHGLTAWQRNQPRPFSKVRRHVDRIEPTLTIFLREHSHTHATPAPAPPSLWRRLWLYASIDALQLCCPAPQHASLQVPKSSEWHHASVQGPPGFPIP